MLQDLGRNIVDAFLRLGDAFLSIIPALLVLVASLITGVLVGFVLRALIRLVLRLGHVDETGLSTASRQMLVAAGVKATPVQIAGAVSFWAAVVVALVVGINALEPGSLKTALSGAVAFLPRLFTAVLLVLAGMGLAALARRSLLIAAVNAGLPWASLGSRLVAAVILVFFAANALEHLGLGRSILVAAFSIAGGGFVFALSLAFGLGGRHLARAYLEKKFSAEREDLGIRHV